MLPLMQLAFYSGIRPIIENFNQSVNFSSDAHSRRNAAAISFDWINMHNEDRMDSFVNDINSPSRVSFILNFQSYYITQGINIFITNAAPLGLGFQDRIIYDPRLISYEQLASELCADNGYSLIFYGSSHDPFGHTVAMCGYASVGYEFFDPNYGSAFFPTEESFMGWYAPFMVSEEHNLGQPYSWFDIVKYEALPADHNRRIGQV